jgi:hypothetical protein
MPKTYEPIATQTLGTASSTVTFSSIPQTYTDLIVVSAPLSGGGEEFVMRFNNDSGTNYSSTILWGSGSVAGSYRSFNETFALLNYYGSVGTTQNTQIFNIMNYSNSTTYKTVLGRAGRADSGVDGSVALWRNTAAITSITIRLKVGSNFSVGSTFTLYGIKAA